MSEPTRQGPHTPTLAQRTKRHAASLLLFFLLAATLPAREPKYVVYVGPITAYTALIAWGTIGESGNTVGRDSTPLGAAQVRIDGRSVPSAKNWVVVEGLTPDTEYRYEVFVDDRKLGEGAVRTLPEQARKLAFFVIGDWGNGSRAQYRIAEVMQREFDKRRETDNPVRFVLTTGDNIYGDYFLARRTNTGNEDKEWEPKFFRPYKKLLTSIPFYPSLGNHDGNVSESAGDLPVYLDNFFFPGNVPARWYSFRVGGLVDFFALDSTWNSLEGSLGPAYSHIGEQFAWMQQALPASTAPWKIVYFHHPPFSAGPRHTALFQELKHWIDLFAEAKVNVAFTGHEHNFQFSRLEAPETRGVMYVVTGAGGELRDQDVRNRLEAAHIAGWSPVNHFLLVEIEGRTLRITPMGFKSVTVRSPHGHIIPTPIELQLPE